MKITNTQSGPRGINTVNGAVLLNAGQSVDADVYAREQQHIESAGWFTIDGDYKADPGVSAAPVAASADISEIDRLKAELAAHDEEIATLKKPADDGTTVNTAPEALALFTTDGVHVNTAKAKAFLGDKVPDDATKDVIVAKLEELAAAV